MHNKYSDLNVREMEERLTLSPAAYIDALDLVPGSFPDREKVVLYVCAGCHGSTGPGAFSVLLVKVDQDGLPAAPALTFTGHSSTFTTEQRMVLQGAQKGLEAVKQSAHLPVLLRSEIQTLVDGLEKWLPGWKRNGWRNAAKKPVASADLWQEIDALCEPLSVRAERVKAGPNDPWQSRCNAARDAALKVAVAEWQAGK